MQEKDLSPVIHESGEDYLEMILRLQEKGLKVRSIDLATEFGFSRPAISKAVKILVNDGYLNVDEKGHLLLTPSGLEKAKAVYERHRFLTEFFLAIGVSPEVAEHDACKIEHDLHQETIDALEKLSKNIKK